ncbi:hypothetical protein [Rhodococcus qingshengii]|uniref:hypothetical protein n=1 Tax=Rhodococcus qingshengii TaxID=334542 RepID=UPI00287FA88D|nr:hypothetical protein [Rhodococcus qingshengii]
MSSYGEDIIRETFEKFGDAIGVQMQMPAAMITNLGAVLQAQIDLLAELQSAGRLIPAGGMALTAEQMEDVEALVATANPYSAPAARLRALFPATEPAAVRDGSDLVVVQRSHTAKVVQSWMTLDLWTDLGKNDKDFDAEYERQGFGDLWATLLGEVRALVQATTPAPAEPAEEETKAEEVCTGSGGHHLYPCVLPDGHAGVHVDRRGLRWQNVASSPVVPAPAETGPWA